MLIISKDELQEMGFEISKRLVLGDNVALIRGNKLVRLGGNCYRRWVGMWLGPQLGLKVL